MEWLFTNKNGKVTLVVLGLALPMFLLMLFREFFALIVVSFALTMVMIPIVDHLEAKGMKRPLAIAITYICILTGIGALAMKSYPIALKQFNEMGISFGVDRPQAGDSVYVQLYTKRLYEGVLQKQDSVTNIVQYDTKNILSWESYDVQIVVKTNDSVYIKNAEGEVEVGILKSNGVFQTENNNRPILPNEEIISRYNRFKEKLLKFEKRMQRSLSFLKESDISSLIDSFIFFILDRVQKVLRSIKTLIGSLIVVPMVTFFFLRDYHKAMKYIMSSIPNKYFEMALNLIGRLENQIGQYIRGVCIEFLLISVIAVLGYSALGLQYAFVLGICVGLFNIIPLIGPVFGVVPALFVSITQTGDVTMMPFIVVINVLVQFLDAKFVKKKLYREFINVHPLLILMLILLGGAAMGLTGTLLAVPLYTSLALTARETMWGLTRYQITSV